MEKRNNISKNGGNARVISKEQIYFNLFFKMYSISLKIMRFASSYMHIVDIDFFFLEVHLKVTYFEVHNYFIF